MRMRTWISLRLKSKLDLVRAQLDELFENYIWDMETYFMIEIHLSEKGSGLFAMGELISKFEN